MEPNETFGAWLRRRRRFMDMTQEQLADCAGCSPVTVRKMEADERRPSRQLAELLADCLSVPAAERAAFVHFARQSAAAREPAHSLTASAFHAAEVDGVSVSGPPRHNLPAPLTSFIGRNVALDDLLRLLRDEKARPLTLTGAGGSGKTRLALEVAIDAAAELGDVLPDGVWWVDLAAIDDETLVSPAVNRALGLVESAEQPIEETLAAYLGDKRLLLILDNCEHLIAVCARLVERLLRRCPTLQLLATSREALGVPGERVFPVPTLSLPDPAAGWQALLASEAVKLFVERAAAQRPGFQLTADNAPAVGQICRRLDGIPLALELAAARAKMLSPAQIADRLDDRFALLTGGARTALPRQQTLRALIDWSHDLLEPAERILFRRLAVFVDGCTLEAAEAICADEPVNGTAAAQLRRGDILELLGRLVDKSLVQVSDGGDLLRYEMLESVRAYAAARLVEAGSAEAARLDDRYLAYFTAWAETVEQAILGPDGAMWLRHTEREMGNLRVALHRALAEGDEARHVAGVRLAAALGQFWLRRNYPQEGSRWTALALDRLSVDGSPVATPPHIQGRLFSVAGTMAWLRSDIDRATMYHERALLCFRKADDPGRVAVALCDLAVQQTMRGYMARALEWTEASAAIARNSGDRWATGTVLLNLGLAYFHLDQPEPAERILSEALAILHEVGDGLCLALTLCALVIVSSRLDRLEEAQAYMAEALQLAAELGDIRLEATARQSWGKVQRQHGGYPAPHFRESLRLFARTTDRLNILETLDELIIQMACGPAAERAARLLGAVDAWRSRLGLARPDEVAAALEGVLPPLRTALGVGGYDAAVGRGAALTLEEAVALALNDGAGKSGAAGK